MRRLWLVCAALILLPACAGHLSAAQDAANKRAFVRQLVGYCAQVDRNLTTVDAKSNPGQWADQLGRFASQARSHNPPSAQREQFDILLTAIHDTVQHFRSAQKALSSGNSDAYQAALEQAGTAMQNASKAAQRYGMPALADCPKVQGGSQSSSAPAQAAGGWQLGHDSLFAVQQVQAAVLQGRIWVAGGLTGPQQATAKTEFYDLTMDTWNPGPPLPFALNHAMMVTYQGRLWVIGGFVAQPGDVTAVASARVLVLDRDQDQWLTGSPLHHARAAAAAAVVGNKIVVVGGRTGRSGQLVTPTEVFDGTRWHDAAAIPIPGDHLAAASDGTYLYAVGGHHITETSNTAAVQRFNPATGQWTPLTAMPSPASGLGAAFIGGQLITVGGGDQASVFSTVRAYNLTTKTWSSLPSLAVARHGMGVVAIGNTLYAIDGAAQPGHTASTPTVQILTFHS
jgi:N-acetylneuraminic acid mutarotase